MLLDGKKQAQEIHLEIERKTKGFQAAKPGLTVVLVGDNPASLSYVRSKHKACQKVGIVSNIIHLPDTIAESDLLKEIDKLNRNVHVHGILVQLPLPPHIDERLITLAIDPKKDVDGFHPINVGKMLIGDEDGFLPCTPLGIQVLLERYKIETSGKHMVIAGRSNIVGKPLAAIMMQKKKNANATVTIVHSGSENFKTITKSADILVAAIGRAKFFDETYIKKEATVIDVGINRVDQKLVGDVDFEKVLPHVKNITPVPGGIGPMTIAMLLKNTLSAFLKFACLLFFLVSCQKKDPCSHFEGFAASKPFHITIGDPLSKNQRKEIQKTINEVFDLHKSHFDLKNEKSEISLINRAKAQTLIPLSPPMQDILSICTQIRNLSSYRFDPTIQPILKLLQKEKKEVTAENMQIACEASGFDHLEIHNAILKKDHGLTEMNLDSISQGFSVDQIVEKLKEMGIKNLMVEWNGKVRAFGKHPEARNWQVEINPNLRSNDQAFAPIPLRNAAIASSGSHFHHIIDPISATHFEKVKGSVAFTAVIAPTCSLADALATATICFHARDDAEKWAQEIVDLYPDVSFWILSHR